MVQEKLAVEREDEEAMDLPSKKRHYGIHIHRGIVNAFPPLSRPPGDPPHWLAVVIPAGDPSNVAE